MSPPINPDQVEAIIHGLARDRRPGGDATALDAGLRHRLDVAGLDHAEVEHRISQLVADASLAAQDGQPGSERGRDLAERWLAIVDLIGPGLVDPSANEATADLVSAMIDQPHLASALTFLREAVELHRPLAAHSGPTGE